jgi:hypothetical protein
MISIDDLEIQITAESDKAVSHLEKLHVVLEKIEAIGHKSGFDLLYRKLKKISSLDFSGATSSMERMASASEKISRSSSRMEHFARSIRKVREETAKAKDEFVRFGSASSFTGITPFTGVIPYQRFNKTNNRGVGGTFGGNLPPIPPTSVPPRNDAYTERTAGLLGDGKTIFLDEDQWKENKFGEWFDRLKVKVHDLADAFKLLRSDTKKSGSQARQTSNSFTYLRKTLMRFAVYKLLNIAIKNITRGLQNVAMYSKEANAVLTEYKTIGLQLGNSIAAALIPVLQTLLPLVRALVDVIIDVSNAVNILFAKMNGQTSFRKAKKYTDDYAQSLGKLRTVASMDEIHTIGQTYNYSEMFEDVEIDSANFTDALATIGQITAALLMLKTVFSGREWAATLTALTGKTIRYSTILKKVGGVLLSIAGVLETIKGASDAWVNGLDWGNFAEILIGIAMTVGGLALTFGALGAQIGGIVGGVVMMVIGIKDAITEGLNWTNGALTAGGATLIGALIGSFFGPVGTLIGAAIGLVVGLVTDLVIWLVQNWDAVSAWFVNLWDGIGNWFVGVGEWFKNIWFNVGDFFKNLWSGISDWFVKMWNGLGEFFINVGKWISVAWGNIGTFFSNLWKGIANGFVTVINGIITGFEAFINFFVKGINWIISGINRISFEVPDWVPGIGGNRVGFNLGYIGEVSFGRLKGYETGGFPEDGLFMANHSELVGRFSNGKTAVANNEQIVEGISRGVSEATSEQNELLREQNKILVRLLSKDTHAVVSVSTITKGLERQNRRNGKTIVPVGT